MRNFIKNISISIISILVMVILAELVLQVAYYVKNDRWVWDTDQTFQFDYIIPTDDSRKYALRPYFYDKVQNMPINQYGERITPQDENPEFQKNTIVCIGDSVPFGFGVSHWDTYPYYLSYLLQSQGYPYFVVNGGVPSYNTRQSFENLKLAVYSHIPPKDVDVIIFQAANDVSLWAYYRENWNEDLTWADVRFNIHSLPLVDRSAIFNYVNQVFSPQKGKNKEVDVDSYSAKLADLISGEIKDIHERSPETKIILLPINPFYYQTANRNKNASLTRFQEFSSDYYQDFVFNLNSAFNTMLENVAGDFDYVYFFDIRKPMDNADREAFYNDYIHLTGAGAQFQAEEIIGFLQENQLISPDGN